MVRQYAFSAIFILNGLGCLLCWRWLAAGHARLNEWILGKRNDRLSRSVAIAVPLAFIAIGVWALFVP